MNKNNCNCAEKANRYRNSLENEIGYPHWSEDEKRLLQKALKWFNGIFAGIGIE